MNNPIDLRQALRSLNDLPAFPVIAQKLLALQLDTEQGEQQMMLLIGQDPLISARLIGLANSPLLGSSRQITSVKEASMMLGLTRVRPSIMDASLTEVIWRELPSNGELARPMSRAEISGSCPINSIICCSPCSVSSWSASSFCAMTGKAGKSFRLRNA